MLYRQFFVVTIAVAAFGILLNQVIETTHKQAGAFQFSTQQSQLVEISSNSVRL